MLQRNPLSGNISMNVQNQMAKPVQRFGNNQAQAVAVATKNTNEIAANAESRKQQMAPAQM